MVVKLGAEGGNTHGLAGLEAADVDAGGGVDKDLRLTRAIINKEAIAKGQIVTHRLSDDAFNLDQSRSPR